MSDPANVRSLDALRQLRVALLRFADEARRSVSALIVEAQTTLKWLQLEQPQYWKRQVEVAYQQLNEARSSLMKCKMRQLGDFRPSCFDEKKALQRAKQRLEHTRNMVNAVQAWSIRSGQEVDEYTSRCAQLHRCLDGDIPRAVALLERLITSIEKYGELQLIQSADEIAPPAADAHKSTEAPVETPPSAQDPETTPAESTTQPDPVPESER